MNWKTLLFLWLVAGINISASAQTDTSLLYEISGNGIEKPSYLFGTFHLLKSEYIQEKQRIQKKFDEADIVVVETLIDSSQIMQVAMMGMMPGKSLKEMLDEKAYNMINEELKASMSVDLSLLDQFKPAYISTMLTQVYANREYTWLEKYQGEIMDVYFAHEGKARQKKVVPLETMKEQASILFNGTSLEDQADQLEEMVLQKEETFSLLQKMGDDYMNENLPGLLELGEKYEDEFNDLTALVDDRNANWMKTIPSLLEEGNAFIAVGALHLPGDQGLIQLLIQKGYTVTAVQP